jgi:hypothetical protein
MGYYYDNAAKNKMHLEKRKRRFFEPKFIGEKIQ